MSEPCRFDPLAWPPFWLILFAAGAWLLGRLWPITTFPKLGWIAVAASVLLMLAAIVTMVRAKATFDPTQRPTALVTHGVFRWSRNPIYLADAVILLGFCLIWQPLAALVLVPAFVWVIGNRFIRQEERWLAAAFPAEFAAWSSRTRRWL